LSIKTLENDQISMKSVLSSCEKWMRCGKILNGTNSKFI